ncbi:helix-turn-helix transcriptional regulator [Streptomyces sp. NPDC005963]|uniref:helix-turn-helix domain-containing protein n=1 Tax=Streptomyces sp. NPDC005963 TaxID=3156721 RepID=UPI0033D9F825
MVASRAGLSPHQVREVLNGAALLSWAETLRLADALSVGAGEVQRLWECAQGLNIQPAASVDAAAGDLRDLLSSLHRAALRPTAVDLARTTGLHAPVVTAILRGEWVPDWPTAAHLARALGAEPGLLRPLWERLHYAFLISPDPFPRHGMPIPTTQHSPPTPPPTLTQEKGPSRGQLQPSAPPPRPR